MRQGPVSGLPALRPTLVQQGHRNAPARCPRVPICAHAELIRAHSGSFRRMKAGSTPLGTSSTFENRWLSLKIPVSGVQFSPCPPFLFGASATLPGEVLDLLEKGSGMHSCSEPNTRDAGWRRRQEEHPRWEPRIPASEQTHQRLEALLKGGVADGDARTELFKLAVRKIVEEALEAEVSDALGRGYYESGAEPGRGYRNGYRRGRLRTAEGAIEYARAAGRGSSRALCVADPGGPGRSDGRARAAGRRAVCARS